MGGIVKKNGNRCDMIHRLLHVPSGNTTEIAVSRDVANC